MGTQRFTSANPILIPALLHQPPENPYRGYVNNNTPRADYLGDGGSGGCSAPRRANRPRIVTLPDSSRAAGVIVMATDAKGETAARALTGEAGTYELRLPGAGHYDVRVLRIGFHPTVVPGFDVTANESKNLPIILRGEAVALSAVNVQGKSTCRMQRDSGQIVARMWEEARKAIEATQLTQGGAKQTVKWRVYERNMDLDRRADDHAVEQYRQRHGDESLCVAAAGFARESRVHERRRPTGHDLPRAPDPEALLSNAFASLHCFREVPGPRDKPDWVGIRFQPAKERDGIVEIEGTLWLDRASSELRQLEFPLHEPSAGSRTHRRGRHGGFSPALDRPLAGQAAGN